MSCVESMDCADTGGGKRGLHLLESEPAFPSYVEVVENLASIMEEMALAGDLQEVMAVTRRAVRELTGADGASFILLEGDMCHYADEEAIAPLWKGKRFPLDQCISGWVMAHREPVVIEDIYDDERIPQAIYLPTLVKSLVLVPVRKHSPVGAIGAYWARKCSPPHEVVKILQALADAASAAMRNVQLLAGMRQKEEALRLSEERYRHLVDTIPVGVYTCDAEGRITFYNHRAAELWGRTPRLGDLAEKFCGSFRMYRADGSPVSHDCCPMALAVKEGRAFRDEEVVIERPDGSRRISSVIIDPIFDEAGNFSGAINAVVDITERKRVEAEAARLAAIVDSSEDAIIGKTLDGTIVSWNRAAERIYGYRAEEVIGRSIAILAPDGEGQEFAGILQKIARSEVVHHYETVRRRKDGELIHVSISFSPIKDRSGGIIIGASTIARDITDLKRAEAALRENERQYRDLVEALPEMAWFARPDGYHEYLNGRWREFTGLSLDESHGDLWSTVLHPDDYERSLKRWRHSLETGEPYEIEYRFRRAEDGEYYWFLGRALPLRNEWGEIVRWFGTCSYIHDQKETEAALRTSEGRFRLVVESSPFPSLIHAEDGEIVMVNPAWTRLSGYTKSDIPTIEDWTERACGERKQQVKSYIDALYGIQGMVAEGEFEVTTARGERRVWDFFTGPLGRDERGRRLLIGTAADVTDRKRAEEALRKAHDELETRVRERTVELSLSNESLKAEMAARKRAEDELRLDEARFEALYELSQMTDLPEREIIDFALEEQLKITRSAIGTLGLLNEDETIYTPYGWSRDTMEECAIHDKPICLDVQKSGIWGQAVLRRKAMVVNDYSVFSPHKKGLPKGHVPVTRFMSIPIFDKDRIVALATVGNKSDDYTEADVRQITLLVDGMWKILQKKRSEEERKRYVARLERLNKELEDFAFIASHHLQEPLRKIHTFGDKLKARCKSFTDPEARDCVTRMQKSADRMRSLVYDLLRYSRVTLEVEELAPTDLSTVLRHVLAGMDEAIQQGRATFEVSPLPVADVDERQIHELFRELIGNAIKFQGQSAPVIKITAEVHRNPDERPYCSIYVQDNGIGFDERQVERIFAPFQQLHGNDSYDGTGMGLAICRKIVERHNGAITARSVPGSGTTFTIVLPLHRDARKLTKEEAA